MWLLAVCLHVHMRTHMCAVRTSTCTASWHDAVYKRVTWVIQAVLPACMYAAARTSCTTMRCDQCAYSMSSVRVFRDWAMARRSCYTPSSFMIAMIARLRGALKWADAAVLTQMPYIGQYINAALHEVTLHHISCRVRVLLLFTSCAIALRIGKEQ
ncbi:hypothetical protein COO60DRAFT_382032 [Scenedesmus sp. NREL 46B-D3]|nr:hypothetical protein COO60DRAFT_382032 [Scenedesmus sp. NREL 46B-D3]